MTSLVIDNIAIPVDLERFIPPDLEDACRYYRAYLHHGGRMKIQPYLCEAVRQYAMFERKRNPAADFEALKDDSLKQFFAHVGLATVFEIFQRCEAEREAVVSEPKPL